MIETLLPSPVAVVEAFTDDPDEPVFPEEEGLIAVAVEARRREFVTARRCAREALARLGCPPVPIRRGPHREPRWPAGVVGSITHCAGYRAAAVARSTDVASVGIDAEPHAPLPDGVLEIVVASGDEDRLTTLARADPSICWDRLLFCAKESIYKAWFPLTGRWLGFEDAQLRLDPAAGTFTGHLLVPGGRLDGGADLVDLSGRYRVTGGLVLTAVTVPRTPA
ncbi:4'-phosphopantetheinyl transferase [Actinoplanes cyaneus]|uniref:4'-phosphopantetheinyl transferase n=1 Tax=Actinoplanes cyaneus TaxID=52696 RepID=A0A919IJD2_9ACTN|nr:4'-phosphopantetheinyl transferase superfamily protein [Actinoplanes cyaneus]MCW2141063.1 4'-phosphopantetheinyl transferase EntD (siderophore biosynthesis) [Actinoplanes cyaneus]GID67125.1 4'-phosphopantetheinyl transferase [Actinoplanes cyaneus]